MGRVFIPQMPAIYDPQTRLWSPKFDLTAAEPHGTVVVILGPEASPGQERHTKTIKAALEDFSDNDYILPAGNPVWTGVVSALAADVNDGAVAFLLWNKRNKAYRPLYFTGLVTFEDGETE